jgi:hypothetical protein
MESANLINYSTDMCWSCPYTTVQAMYLTKQEVMKLGDGYGCWAVFGEGDSRVMGFIVDSHLTRRIQVVIGPE